MGAKKEILELENPGAENRQMVHSQQCSTSNTNRDEGWRREGCFVKAQQGHSLSPALRVVHYHKALSISLFITAIVSYMLFGSIRKAAEITAITLKDRDRL